MKHVTAVITICALFVSPLWIADADAWSGCTIEQRIELGKQGYDKGEVEKACRDGSDVFLDILNGAVGIGLKKWEESGNKHKTDTSVASNGASMCTTNRGTCPLPGGPVGHACYCRWPNGYTLPGISK